MTVAPLAAAVFDLDGVLIDSESIQIDAWRRFLACYGHPLEQALLDQLFGLRVWDTGRLMVETFRLPLSVDDVIAERDAIFFAALRGNIRPMPFAVETVRELGARGLRLGLATSGHRRYVDLALDGLGLTGAFAAEVTGGEVTRGKPAPDIYLEAAARLGVPPLSCVAFEDAPHGVAAAKAAGMWCLAVPNELTAELPGLDAADGIVDSLREGVSWLASRGWLPGGNPGEAP